MEGKGRAGAASTSGQEAWWEVDLGDVHQVHLVDVWAGKQAAAQGAYPPIIPLPARHTLAQKSATKSHISNLLY
jgi:hypothetical protein